ncbi:hypothetical protein CL614_04540 [archaeon]|nr:hypothetical protein [archaeon]|tara:strand:- start:927 stop:1931 length:1005 start_codon:yes stop_codon:yes gene_type:complete
MPKLSNYFDLIYGQHRFNFLFQDDYISKYCKTFYRNEKILEKSPLIAFIGKTFNVYWEYRDGVLDSASPVESCVILYQILEKFGNKPFFYVKPNFSSTKCKNIIDLAAENNGVVITCPKWSYMEFYYAFYPHRKELRKHNCFSSKKSDITFLGSLRENEGYRRPLANYTDETYKYPVYPPQLDWLKHAPPDASREQTDVPYPQRKYFVDKLSEHFSIDMFHGKSTQECLNLYLESKMQFQPHGVGPRHSIYECMMLGIPSIIPECSYLDSVTRSSNIICSEFMKDVPTKDIKELLENPEVYEETKNGMIDLYEKHMTPHAIIDCVFNQVEGISS